MPKVRSKRAKRSSKKMSATTDVVQKTISDINKEIQKFLEAEQRFRNNLSAIAQTYKQTYPNKEDLEKTFDKILKKSEFYNEIADEDGVTSNMMFEIVGSM